jgi:hypothetical protein
MNTDWFPEWVANYCAATGTIDPLRSVVLGTRHALLAELGASPVELGEVTARLANDDRAPRDPGEVTNALVRELRELREERARLGRPDAADDAWEAPRGPTCLQCGDTGLVTVPHRACVRDRRISLGRQTAHRFLTGSVLCDRPGCDPGRRARDDEARREVGRRGPRPTLADYSRELNCDPVELLREYEAAQAVIARRALGQAGDADFGALVARIKRRAEGEQTEAA